MVLVAGAVGPRRAGAAEPGGERITVYDVDVKVEATGSLLVTEAIDYDFGPNNRHGIYRDIPVRKYGGPDRPDRLYTLHVVSVDASEGTPHGYELQREGNARRLKIGDADRTITGAHRYTIVYRMDAALDGFADHDELYWNAIGTEWSVPIERATVRVTTPAPITDVACFEGGFGSHTACSQAEQAGSVADFSQDNLGPSENVTVVVGFAKGAVPAPVPVLVDRFSFSRSFHRAFAVTPATFGISALLLVAILAALARLAWATDVTAVPSVPRWTWPSPPRAPRKGLARRSTHSAAP